MRLKCWNVALALLGAAVCLSATARADDVTFRDLARKYFKNGDGGELAKLVGYSKPVKQVIALEYKVLLFKDGHETAVDPKTTNFRIGDKIRVEIEPLNDYYVYIFHIGASGKKEFLLPAEDEQPPMSKAGKPLALPGDGFLEFTDPAGDEALLVVATEKPVENRAILARVLTKKPGEQDTPEEEAVRKTIKATVTKAMKSARERQKEIMNNTVMYRGLTTDAAMNDLVNDVNARGVTDGTIEEPSRDKKGGTCALYVSMTKRDEARLLVTIPLKSLSKR
jgi:hypothetical protein